MFPRGWLRAWCCIVFGTCADARAFGWAFFELCSGILSGIMVLLFWFRGELNLNFARFETKTEAPLYMKAASTEQFEISTNSTVQEAAFFPEAVAF